MTQGRAGVVIALAMATATATALHRASTAGRLDLGPAGTGTGMPAVIVGCALTVAALAYFVALRAPAPRLSPRHLLLALVIHLCAAPAPPFTSSDIFMNLAYGRLANLGLNPYTTPPRLLTQSDPYRRGLDWPDVPTAWGPITTQAGAIAARQTSQTQAVVAFKVLMAGAVLLAVVGAFLYSRALPSHESTGTFVFFAFNPLLAWELTGQAHNDALLVLAATLFVWAAPARRQALAVLSLCLGILAKYAVAPTLALYLLLLRRASWRRTLEIGLVGLLVGGLFWQPFFEGSDSLRGLQIAAGHELVRVVNSPASFVRLVGNALALPWLFRLWSAMVLVAMAAMALRCATRARSLDDVLRDSLAFTLLYQVFAMPSFWPWYATWLLPLAMARPNAPLRPAVATFSALAPALYLTGAAGAFAILLVDGLTLYLLFRARRGFFGPLVTAG